MKATVLTSFVIGGILFSQMAGANEDSASPDGMSLYANMVRALDLGQIEALKITFTQCTPQGRFGCSIKEWYSILDDGVRLRACHVELLDREKYLSHPAADPARLELLRRAECVAYNLGDTVTQWTLYPNMPGYPGPKEWNNIYLVDCGNCPSHPQYALWKASKCGYGRRRMILGGWHDHPTDFMQDLFKASESVVFPEGKCCGGLEVLEATATSVGTERELIKARYSWKEGGGKSFTVVYDARNLPAPLEIVESDANGNITSRQVFDGWHRSGEYLWPEVVETYGSGDGWVLPVSRIEIHSCEINPTFSESDFEVNIPDNATVLDGRTWPFLVDGKPMPNAYKVVTYDRQGNLVEMTEDEIRERFGF